MASPPFRNRRLPRLAALVSLATLFAVLQGAASSSAATSSVSRGDPLPLGTLALDGRVDPGCPTGFRCKGFKLVCPNLSRPESAFFATSSPVGPPRGVVVFFSGTTGHGYWSGGSRLTGPFMDLLRLDGFEVVQVRWLEGWLISAPGEAVGSEMLACRPATVIQWIHDNIYLPLRIHARLGECGFCLTGQSGGGDQAMYPLASYGLDRIVDAVIPTSSPTHTALEQGCLAAPGLGYSRSDAQFIDSSYGFIGSLEWQGPCVNRDPSFAQQWRQDALDTGGIDFVYTTTRVHFIGGALDQSSAPAHARVFYDLLTQSGSPYLSSEVIATMDHSIADSAQGLDALRRALLGSV